MTEQQILAKYMDAQSDFNKVAEKNIRELTEKVSFLTSKISIMQDSMYSQAITIVRLQREIN